MNKEHTTTCPNEGAIIEEDGHVDKTKPCLREVIKKLGVKAGRGKCERCGAFVTHGDFDGASAGSLTKFEK